jgi:hypothetical protein
LAVELGDEALRLATDLAAEEAEILRRHR